MNYTETCKIDLIEFIWVKYVWPAGELGRILIPQGKFLIMKQSGGKAYKMPYAFFIFCSERENFVS